MTQADKERLEASEMWIWRRQSIKCRSTAESTRKQEHLRHCTTSQIQMDWTHPETWFTFTWYNRKQDEGKSYKRKETATNAKWCNQQVLWRVKERGWRQKLVEEKGVKPAIQGRKPKREHKYDLAELRNDISRVCMSSWVLSVSLLLVCVLFNWSVKCWVLFVRSEAKESEKKSFLGMIFSR